MTFTVETFCVEDATFHQNSRLKTFKKAPEKKLQNPKNYPFATSHLVDFVGVWGRFPFMIPCDPINHVNVCGKSEVRGRCLQ